MSASDARYEEAVRHVRESIERGKRSEAARAQGETRHWYFTDEHYCPICGRSDGGRQRVYGPRPEAWEDRHYFTESYDYCDAL